MSTKPCLIGASAALAACLGTFSVASPALAQTNMFHPLVVKKHGGVNGPVVTTARIDQCLNLATNILQQDADGAGTTDAVCTTNLYRSGSVGTFFASDGNVSTAAEINAVQNTSGFLKVVKTITYCSGNAVIGAIAGCTQMNAHNGIILADNAFASSACGKVIAHEFGHSVGFGHATAALINNVMQQGENTLLSRVTSQQCPFFRSSCMDYDGPGGTSSPNGCVSPVVGPLTPDVLNLDGMSIQQLAYEGLGDRVPVEAMDHYTQEDAEILAQMLADPDQKPHHPAVARLLGLVGNDVQRNARVLIKYLRSNTDDAGTVSAAVISLGYLANRGSDRALKYLVRKVDAVDSAMADWAVSALAVSGKQEALTQLHRIHRDADAVDRRFKRYGRGPALIAQALAHHVKVRDGGLRAYYGH